MEIKTIRTFWAKDQLKQNTHLVILDDGIIVIDAGTSPSEIKKLCDKKILAVFITHCHIDHIRCIDEFDKLNIPIYMNEKGLKFLADSTLNLGVYFGENKPFKLKNIILINDLQKININGAVVQTIFLPGHTDDSVGFLIGKNFFSGDTLFNVAVGGTGFSTSDPKQLLKSLERIKTLNFNYMYAGHGGISTKNDQIKNIEKWSLIL